MSNEHKVHPRNRQQPKSPQELPPGAHVVYVERPRREWSGSAIASFVFSILWLFGLGSLLAIAFGLGGIRECDREGRQGMAFAVIGLTFGILGLLAMVLTIVSRG